MSNPYPIPREIRQSAILLGDGGNVYGPFDFKIFDAGDVEVFVRLPSAVEFLPVAAEVTKVADLPLDFFTIEFPFAVEPAAAYIVRSARLHERSAGVKDGTRLDPDALEKELSKQGTVLQELRRDIDRTVMLELGAPGITINDEIPDGSVLMKSGDRLVRGPSATDLIDVADRAEAAAAAAAVFEAHAGGFAGQAEGSAAGAAASQAQAQILVDMATAGYAGFQPGTFYDLGRVTDSLELFPGDLGRVTDI